MTMTKQAWIATSVVLAMAGLVAGGYHLMANREGQFCGFCHRSVHPNTKVVAEIDGRRRTVCCARCAISEAYQEKKPLRLIAATDYVSGKDIDPKQAYFVEGSHRVLCAHNEAMVDESKHVQRSEEHTSELQSHSDLVCRLLLEKKKKKNTKKRNSATIHT